MKKLIIDFEIIKSENQLNHLLTKELDLPARIAGEYGYNLSAFWDTYAYSQDADYFELMKQRKSTIKNCINVVNHLLNF